MAKMLLLNPRPRRKSRKAPSAAQRANWARFAAMAKGRKTKRRKNPAASSRTSTAGSPRRSNPLGAYRRASRRVARRRNPISMRGVTGGLFNFRSYIAPLKDAAVMGAGAVAMDVGFSYVNRYLPASMQRVPGTVGVGDAVKAVLTVALGKLLAKPTKGLSQKAAMGSLVVQMRDITTAMLPASMGVSGLGWMTNARVVPGMNARANSYTRAPARIGAYVPGPSPALSGPVGGFVPGASPLLSRAPMTRGRR